MRRFAVRSLAACLLAAGLSGVSALPTSAAPPDSALRNNESGLCLSHRPDDGRAITETCDGSPDQQWSVRAVGHGFVRLQNPTSGLCLSADDSEPEVADCDGEAHQRWERRGAGGGAFSYQLEGADCLDSTPAGRVTIDHCEGSDSQAWRGR